MNALTNLAPGKWGLVIVTREERPVLLTLAARMAERGPLRVLDGGNQFNAYPVARAARGRRDVLTRIQVSRAFTCYQMLALLESTPSPPCPFLLLDLLDTFYDENVPLIARQRLLEGCLHHLARLSQQASGLVSISTPRISNPANSSLLEAVQNAAHEVWYSDLSTPEPQPLSLF